MINIDAYSEGIDFNKRNVKPVKMESETVTEHSLNNRDIKVNKVFLR